MSYPARRYSDTSEVIETIVGVTVAELIAQLQRFPPDHCVAVEGCDCIGPAWEAVADKADDGSAMVLITRKGSH